MSISGEPVFHWDPHGLAKKVDMAKPFSNLRVLEDRDASLASVRWARLSHACGHVLSALIGCRGLKTFLRKKPDVVSQLVKRASDPWRSGNRPATPSATINRTRRPGLPWIVRWLSEAFFLIRKISPIKTEKLLRKWGEKGILTGSYPVLRIVNPNIENTPHKWYRMTSFYIAVVIVIIIQNISVII